MRYSLLALVILGVSTRPAVSQEDHVDHSGHAAPAPVELGTGNWELPKLSGQDAYAAVAEVVRLLQADSTTDWSRVNLEGLRQHLIDMNEVTLRSTVRQENLPDGARFSVTGAGRTLAAIRAMLPAHARMLDGLAEYHAVARPLATGVELTVTARVPGDAAGVQRVQGLGFIGLLTADDHHAAHHLALARGR